MEESEGEHPFPSEKEQGCSMALSHSSRPFHVALLGGLLAFGCATLQSPDSSGGQGQDGQAGSEDGSPGGLDGASDASDGDEAGSMPSGDGDGSGNDSTDAGNGHGDGASIDAGGGEGGDDEPTNGNDNPGDDGSLDGTDGSGDDGSGGGDGNDESSWEPAGNAACGRVPPSGSVAVIDDLEDGNAQIRRADNRLGYWYSYRDEADASGMIDTPIVSDGGANDSLKAIKVAGKSAASATYGPGFGFGFYTVGTGANALDCPYDASAYGGISFWIRGTGVTTLRVVIPSESTLEKTSGGTCATNCGDHFGKAVSVSNVWQKITLKWSELAQEGWGAPATFTPSRVSGVLWSVAPGATFELRVDDIEFIAP